MKAMQPAYHESILPQAMKPTEAERSFRKPEIRKRNNMKIKKQRINNQHTPDLQKAGDAAGIEPAY